MRTPQGRIFGLLIAGILAFLTFGRASGEFRTSHALSGPDRIHHFSALHSMSEYGERSAVFFHLEKRRFLPDTKMPVLYARDLDADGFYDAWFHPDDAGLMQGHDLPSTRQDGWDVAARILRSDVAVESRNLAPLAFNWLAGMLTLTKSQEVGFYHQLAQDTLLIEALEIQVSRIARQDPAHHLIPLYRQQISEAWQDVIRRAESQTIKRAVLLGFGDLALFLSGTAIIKGLKYAGARLSPWLIRGSIRELAVRLHLGFVLRLQERSARALRKLGFARLRMATGETGAIATTAHFAKLAVMKRIDLILKGLDARGRAGRLMLKGFETSVRAGKAGLMEWKYITMSSTLQLIAETWNRRDVVWDPNPIILAKNILNNRDMIQNLSYMTIETAMMASIAATVPNTRKAMAISGVLAFGNSSAMSYLVKGEEDPLRNAMDTGWEVVIGNSQVHLIDYKAARYFENLALRNNNPKLKLLGWAVRIVNQGAGYLLYGKATQKYEESKERKEDGPEIRFTPILAETQ